ncbi:MAG TPA: GAP family protein, partial [Solirubrobacteraceae bacterium]|nr:GAP family protein [Solirubrobacteraceae bacterium]
IVEREKAEEAEKETKARSGSAFVAGVGIALAELPTAFPYFAAIAAIVGSGASPIKQLGLLVLFNVCFVLPLLAILAILWLYPSHAQEYLTRARLFLHRHWPKLLAGAALLVGLFVIVLGVTGLAGHGHGRFGRFLRHVHNLIQ